MPGNLVLPPQNLIDFSDVPPLEGTALTPANVIVHFGSNVSKASRIQILEKLDISVSDFPSIDVMPASQVTNLDQPRTFALVISENVNPGETFLIDFLRVAEYTNAALVYSDFTAGSDSLKIHKLPTWSPIRLTQLDYLGPCLLVNLHALGLTSNSLNDSDFRKSVIDSAVGQKVSGARVPKPTYHQVGQFVRGQISHLVNLDSQQISVSLIIPTRGKEIESEKSSLVEKCLAEIFKEPIEENKLEIVLVVDSGYSQSVIERVRSNCPAHLQLKVIEFTDQFNFSKKCNLGVSQASYDTFVFLNDDTEGINFGDIRKLAMIAQQKDVGAVGAQLRFDDDSIQHGGITLSDIKPRNAFLDQFSAETPCGDLELVIEVSAVTGACLAIKKDKLEAAGLWNESFPSSYNDVDLCLKLNTLGYQSILNNHVVITHHESISRDDSFDVNAFSLLKSRWQMFLGSERYLRGSVFIQTPETSFGKYKNHRNNFEGRYLKYVLHLVKTYGPLRSIQVLTAGLKIRKSGLLKPETHNYL